MANVLIRDLDDEVYERLETIALMNNRSLEDELRAILTTASKQVVAASALGESESMRRRLAAGGRLHSDSAELIREDRDR